MDEVQQLVTSIARLQVVRNVTVVSMCLLGVDWAMLFQEEVELIWKLRWSKIKVLYLLSRFLPFLDTITSTIHWTAPHVRPDQCLKIYKIAATSTHVGMAVSELILLFRTYAIWGNSKRILYFLLVVWLGIIGSATFTTIIFVDSLGFGPPPLPGLPGCYMDQGNDIVFWNFVLLLIIETLFVLLTIIKAIQHFRYSSGHVMVTLFRDGILFFIILASLSLATVLILLYGPPEYSDLLTTITRVFHSLLCCRMLLNLRAAAMFTTRVPVNLSDFGTADMPLPQFRRAKITSSVGEATFGFEAVKTKKSLDRELGEEFGGQLRSHNYAMDDESADDTLDIGANRCYAESIAESLEPETPCDAPRVPIPDVERKDDEHSMSDVIVEEGEDTMDLSSPTFR